MKKICAVVFSLAMLLGVSLVNAQETQAAKPRVAVMYVNNAKTKYDTELDQNLLGNLHNCLPPDKYVYVEGKTYLDKLNKMGIVDVATAERADIVDCLKGEDIDYAIFLEAQPFIRKEKMSLFSYGIEMTAVLPFKIIDIENNKYLYNGKFTEKATDSVVIGGLGNKAIAVKALDKANAQIREIIATRLPKA